MVVKTLHREVIQSKSYSLKKNIEKEEEEMGEGEGGVSLLVNPNNE